jgi:hypothetical protein
MAATVIGHWELSWNSPIKEAELWNMALREFGVADWWMWPVSGIRHSEHRVNLHERESFTAIMDELDQVRPDATRVFLEPRNPTFPLDSEDLHTFDHPEDVIYIFGSNHFNPTISNLRPGDLAVTIPTVRNDGVLWPHQCFVTVSYDRLVKSWQ